MTTRRDFLKASVVMAGGLSLARSSYAEGGDAIKGGLIGCGGSRTGAIWKLPNPRPGGEVGPIETRPPDQPQCLPPFPPWQFR